MKQIDFYFHKKYDNALTDIKVKEKYISSILHSPLPNYNILLDSGKSQYGFISHNNRILAWPILLATHIFPSEIPHSPECIFFM